MKINIQKRFYESLTEPPRRDGKIHVSHLIHKCLRRSYYGIKLGEDFLHTKTLLTFWLGKKVHEIPVLAEHELKLEWNGIVGTVDEYENGLIVEKKTTVWDVEQPMGHHKMQLYFYAVMLLKNNKEVNEMKIMYIDINKKDLKVFDVTVPDLKFYERMMTKRKEILSQCLDGNILPINFPSWMCKYCPFGSLCFRDKNV